MKGIRERLGLSADGHEELTPKLQMGIALAASGKPTYSGTVPYAETQRRRVKSRRQRAARRISRGRR